jgi:hypothetical protein
MRDRLHSMTCLLAMIVASAAPLAGAATYEPDDLVRLEPLDEPKTGFNGFGTSMAASGTTLLVAAPGVDSGRGVVYVYGRRSATQWDQAAKLISPDGMFGFGDKVDISGNTALVRQNSVIHVFVRQGSSWVRQARLELNGQPPVDAAIEGDRLILISLRTGFAYAYRRANGVWSRQATLAPDVNAAMFRTVAIGDGVAVIGAPTSFGAILSSDPGSVYVFRLKAVAGQRDVWVRETRLHPPLGLSEAGSFGLSLDVSRNRVAVASRREEDLRGVVYVFARRSDGRWMQTARLAPVDTSRHCFGDTVAIHYDRIAITAPCLSTGAPQSGVRSVHVFQRNSGLETWRRRDRIFPGEGAVPIGTALSNCGTFMGVPDAGHLTPLWDVAYVQPSPVCAPPITP